MGWRCDRTGVQAQRRRGDPRDAGCRRQSQQVEQPSAGDLFDDRGLVRSGGELGSVDADIRVEQMDAEGFGPCTLFGECQEACPKSISINTIADMNRDFITASLSAREEKPLTGEG